MSMTTTLLRGTRTVTPGGGNRPENRVNELLHHYLRMIQQPKMGWTEHLYLRRLLGKGRVTNQQHGARAHEADDG